MPVDRSDEEEPKSERFNMFISKSELEAIEDWGWKNRVRSKSEAVRRLVQIGLMADARLQVITDQSDSSLRETYKLCRSIVELLNRKGLDDKSSADLVNQSVDLVNSSNELHLEVLSLWNAVVPFVNERSVPKAMMASQANIISMLPKFKSLTDREEEGELNRLMIIATSDWSPKQRQQFELLSEQDKEAQLLLEIENVRLREAAEKGSEK